MKVRLLQACLLLQSALLLYLLAGWSGHLPQRLWLVRAGPEAGAAAATSDEDEAKPGRAGGAVGVAGSASGGAGSAPGTRSDAAVGIPVVHLSGPVQQASGIEIGRLGAAAPLTGDPVWADVQSVTPLIEARARLQQADAEVAQHGALLGQALRERERQEQLWQDGGNTALRQLEQARTEAIAAGQQQQALQAQAQSLREALRSDWGAAILQSVESPGQGPLQAVFSGRDCLLLAASDTVRRARILIGDGADSLAAQRFAEAPRAQGAHGAATWWWLSACGRLRSGQHVALLPEPAMPAHPRTAPGLLPDEAVVWLAGQTWVYVPLAGDRFERRTVRLGRGMGARWMLEQGPAAGTPVVLRGAQILLSEESKAQIRNENGD